MNILNRIHSICENNFDKTAAFTVNSQGQRHSITYGDLWTKSTALANWISNTISDSAPLVVYGHKMPSMLIAFIACVKSGHAYCPVDSSMAEERICDIIDTLGSTLVLNCTECETKFDSIPVNTVICDLAESAQVCEDTPEKWVKGNDTFYIIFTSGSTGKPKGIEISSDNLSAFIDWSIHFYEESGVVMNQAPWSFDLSVMDTYSALACGHTLFCLDKAFSDDTESLIKLMKDGKVNYVVSTPSFANLLLSSKDFNENNLPDIKQFLFCGETLTTESAARLHTSFGKSKIINTYGPTECTVCVSEVVINEEMLASGSALPIGYAKPGTSLAIENEEIVIYGNTVGKGYYNNPDKTAAVFGVTPYGDRFYRTGDRGYEVDGMFYYLGRMDSQIKFHGYRIELGDIEENLLQVDGIIEAAVIPRIKEGQIRSLSAYVVLDNNCNIPTDVTEAYILSKSVKADLLKRLPEYMVPKKINFIANMPLTNNGKIDRKKLVNYK